MQNNSHETAKHQIETDRHHSQHYLLLLKGDDGMGRDVHEQRMAVLALGAPAQRVEAGDGNVWWDTNEG